MHPIARYRRFKGWRQADLAAEMQVALNTIQRWESGAEPRPKAFRELAQLLEVAPADLDREIQEWRAANTQKAA